MARRTTSTKPIQKASRTLEQCLHGENVDALLATLKPHERQLLEQMVVELRTTGTSSELENLWKVDYLKKPPTIREFVEDPYWLGETLMPRDDNPGLFPPWKEILARDFDVDSRIHNVVVTGSLGIGKTYVSAALLLYRLVLTSLLRNPQNFVGLSKGSRIVYVVMSVTRAVVAETVFGDVMNFMANSPYFVEELGYNPAKKYGSQLIPLGPSLYLSGGSKGQHVIGRNTLGVLLDEGNWRLEAKPDLKAYKLYDEVRTRIKNRFQKFAGFLPAISLIASSAKDESSFTEKVMADIRKVNDPRTEVIYNFAVYGVKSAKAWRRLGAPESLIEKHALKFKPRWFKVVYGLKNRDPFILKGWFDEDGLPIKGETCEDPPIGCKLELVPEDFLAEFERNARVNLQSLSGISTGGSYRLFPSMVDVLASVELGKKLGAVNPARLTEIPLSDEDDLELWDFLDHPKFLTRRGGRVQPRRHPAALRFAHVDLATRTMAGLSICHLVGYQDVQGLVDTRSGQVYSEARLVVEYDMVLTITAGKHRPINFEKIMRLFLWLRDRAGFVFGMITADQFQSHMTLEMLATRGLPTGLISLDRTKKPYYAWRTGFEEKRIIAVEQPHFQREAENLLDLPDKVDHPQEGSKDTTDSMCGAYWDAITAEEKGAFDLSTVAIVQDSNVGGPVPEGEPAPVKLEIAATKRSARSYRG